MGFWCQLRGWPFGAHDIANEDYVYARDVFERNKEQQGTTDEVTTPVKKVTATINKTGNVQYV